MNEADAIEWVGRSGGWIRRRVTITRGDDGNDDDDDDYNGIDSRVDKNGIIKCRK